MQIQFGQIKSVGLVRPEVIDAKITNDAVNRVDILGQDKGFVGEMSVRGVPAGKSMRFQVTPAKGKSSPIRLQSGLVTLGVASFLRKLGLGGLVSDKTQVKVQIPLYEGPMDEKLRAQIEAEKDPKLKAKLQAKIKQQLLADIEAELAADFLALTKLHNQRVDKGKFRLPNFLENVASRLPNGSGVLEVTDPKLKSAGNPTGKNGDIISYYPQENLLKLNFAVSDVPTVLIPQRFGLEKLHDFVQKKRTKHHRFLVTINMENKQVTSFKEISEKGTVERPPHQAVPRVDSFIAQFSRLMPMKTAEPETTQEQAAEPAPEAVVIDSPVTEVPAETQVPVHQEPPTLIVPEAIINDLHPSVLRDMDGGTKQRADRDAYYLANLPFIVAEYGQENPKLAEAAKSAWDYLDEYDPEYPSTDELRAWLDIIDDELNASYEPVNMQAIVDSIIQRGNEVIAAQQQTPASAEEAETATHTARIYDTED